MNLYVYSDESGVFDNKHENFFVFGGLIFLDKEERDNAARQYKAIEKQIRNILKVRGEIKANSLYNNDKRRLFSSMNKYIKFGIVIDLSRVLEEIFADKKSKQRYLDYAYKIGVKSALVKLSQAGKINLEDINNIYFFCDEHTTATNGKYELKEALEQEFKRGTFNTSYIRYFPPITPALNSLDLSYCNSDKVILIRAADIIANKIYHHAKRENLDTIKDILIRILP